MQSARYDIGKENAMGGEFYEKECYFRIYAIILRAEAKYVYVGKTTGRRLSATYSRHRCGSIQATVGYFDREEPPELYLLEERKLTGSDAYRYVVAWCAVFRKNGYLGINHEGTLFQAENLLPETKCIEENLLQEPLEQLLARTLLASPAAADRLPEKHSQVLVSEKTAQMNMRIRKHDKEYFDKYCRARNLNQREGFSVLLDELMGSDENPGLDRILRDRDRKIASLEQEKRRLKEKMETQLSCGKSRRELEQENTLRLLKTGLTGYFQLLFPDLSGKAALPELSYRKFMKRLPPGQEKPKYPETEGFLLLRLEAILWGSSSRSASFLVGVGQDGFRYMLRFYPRENFWGVFPRSSAWAFAGSWWYVCGRKSADGAMDMMAAFPIGLQKGNEVDDQKTDKQERKESLTKIIQNAENKKPCSMA